jgi:hypothetical protein
MYRLYVDETGNADLRASRDANHRYLSLTGIAMNLSYAGSVAVPNDGGYQSQILWVTSR